MLPWLLCAALAAIVLVLCVRLRLLQTALDEIAAQLGERLTGDTNTPIFLPTQNPHARKLAAELNVQLRELRRPTAPSAPPVAVRVPAGVRVLRAACRFTHRQVPSPRDMPAKPSPLSNWLSVPFWRNNVTSFSRPRSKARPEAT